MTLTPGLSTNRSFSRLNRRPNRIKATLVTEAEIPCLHSFVDAAMGPNIASLETVRQVHQKQRSSMWKVRDKAGKWSGAYAFLYLNDAGVEAVMRNEFNSRTPNMDHLAAKPSEVAGIFTWCLVLRGKSKAALAQAATWLELCGWNDKPIFTNPVTPNGARLARQLGFAPLNASAEAGIHVAY